MPTLEGQRKVRDLMIEGMGRQGIEEAPCVEFHMKDGSIIEVTTENHPILNRNANEVTRMSFKSSAEAG